MNFRPGYFFIFFLIAFGCERSSDDTNQFITDFLNQNTVQVYKSEMQRARVHFIPRTKVLVYSFWNKEVFNKNGDLFLHLYLKDTALLPKTRKEHGFINLSIKNEDIIIMDSIAFYTVKDLSSFGELDNFITGQYIGTKRTWFAKYQVNTDSTTEFIEDYNLKDLDSVRKKLTKRPIALGRTNTLNQKITFINYLLLSDTSLIFMEKNDLNVFLRQDNSQVYLTVNLSSDFLRREYSLKFFEGLEDTRPLLDIALYNEGTFNFNSGNSEVSAVKIKVPEKAKRMALFCQISEKPVVIFNTKLH